MAEDMTSIQVSVITHERLSKRGKYGDSMNDIVVALLDEVEKK